MSGISYKPRAKIIAILFTTQLATALAPLPELLVHHLSISRI
jgi:hypothetical protein